MGADNVAALARAIVDQTFLGSWQFYALLAAIAFLCSVTGALVGKYVGKRGETLATKADFEELKRQLRESTELTERIKAEVKQLVDRKERWHWLRREKLEEYLGSVQQVTSFVYEQMRTAVVEKEYPFGQSISPINRAALLQTLYFPELMLEQDELQEGVRRFNEWLGFAIIRQITDAALERPEGEEMPGFREIYYEQIFNAVSKIEVSAEKLARTLGGT